MNQWYWKYFIVNQYENSFIWLFLFFILGTVMILELKVGNFKGTWASIYGWEGTETEKNTEKERERESD